MYKRLVGLVTFLLVLAISTSALAAPVLAPTPARTVSVTVVGHQGAPLADAVVELLTPGVAPFLMTRTNNQGQASISLPDGFGFWLRVWADGYAVLERPYVPASDGPVLTLSATPYRASLVGLVTDGQGRPVSGAQVTAWLDNMGLQDTAATDDRGYYSFDGLVARSGYTLQVEARTFAPFVQTDLTLAAGAIEQADAVLTPAAGTVTGEVVNSRTNEAAPNIKVELVLNDWGVIARTFTDKSGYFTLNAPPSDEDAYQVRLTARNYETYTSAAFTVGADSWADFGGSNRIALNPLYAELSGSVLNDSGQPLANTPVQLQRSGLGNVDTGKTDENGYYTFAGIPAGTYRVRAIAGNGHELNASDWVSLTGGDRVTADVTALQADLVSFGSTAIVGTVRNHLNNPVADATVTVSRGSQQRVVKTDSQGRYRVSVEANIEDEIDPETSSGYHVLVTKDGYLPNDQQKTVDDTLPPALVDARYKATNRADFTLQPATGTMAGRVLDDQGRPVSGLTVLLIQEGEAEVARTTTSATGQYRFPDLPAAKQARYTAMVSHSDYFVGAIGADGSLLAPVSLQPGSAVTQTLTAQPALATIQGIVTAGADRPGKGALITVVRPADGKTYSATAAADGTYRITVETGPGHEYLLRAYLPDAPSATVAGSITPAEQQGVVANLTVLPLATVSGRVYWPDGKPAGSVAVYLFEEGAGKPPRQVATDSQGYYRFTGVTPGYRYNVAVQTGINNLWSSLAPGEAVMTPLVTPAAGQTVWTDLVTPVSAGDGGTR
jgi:protocatechuate 3,4-dioxygenase beta subunit